MHSKPNEQLFSQTGGHSATLIENSRLNIYFYLFSILNDKQNKAGSIMGNSYSIDHIHSHITYNIEESQQIHRLVTVSNILLGEGGRQGEGGLQQLQHSLR